MDKQAETAVNDAVKMGVEAIKAAAEHEKTVVVVTVVPVYIKQAIINKGNTDD